MKNELLQSLFTCVDGAAQIFLPKAPVSRGQFYKRVPADDQQGVSDKVVFAIFLLFSGKCSKVDAVCRNMIAACCFRKAEMTACLV
jgi:hypothetical protein